MNGPSDWDDWDQEDAAQETERQKRKIILYAAAAGALSILIPLAGFLYVRTNSKAKIPVPPASQIFSRAAAGISPQDRAMMPPSKSLVLSQQQGVGSLSYVIGSSDYARETPPPAPKFFIAPPLSPPTPKPKHRLKIAAAKPQKKRAAFVPPTLDAAPGFGGGGFGSGFGQGPLSGSPPTGTSQNIGSLIKNITGGIGGSLGGLSNLSGLSAISRMIGGGSNSGAATGAQAPAPGGP
ncbi:MAG: hypothetical protein ACYCPQ_08775 [Elusimicrobiota bacterium]